MAIVTIYLKGWRDGRLYADAVNFDSHPLHDHAMTVFNRSFQPYEPGDDTYRAITYTVDDDGDDNTILNDAFERFNVGDERDQVVFTYRKRGHRSLSVGDVVRIERRSYTVAPMGFDRVEFHPTRYARYAWRITEDFLDSVTEVHPRRHQFVEPPRSKPSGVAGPRNAHPNALKRLADGEGQRFELFDDDGILYYRGLWFEDVTKVAKVEEQDLTPDDFEGNPLDDYGTPNAGAVLMTVDAERKPYIG